MSLFEKLTHSNRNEISRDAIFVIPDDETVKWFIDEIIQADEGIFEALAEEFSLVNNHIFPIMMISSGSNKARMKSRTIISAHFGDTNGWVLNGENELQLLEENVYSTATILLADQQEEKFLARATELKALKNTLPLQKFDNNLISYLMGYLSPKDALALCYLSKSFFDFCKGRVSRTIFSQFINKYYAKFDPEGFGGNKREALMELVKGSQLYKDGKPVEGFSSIRELSHARNYMLETGGNVYQLAENEGEIRLIYESGQFGSVLRLNQSETNQNLIGYTEDLYIFYRVFDDIQTAPLIKFDSYIIESYIEPNAESTGLLPSYIYNLYENGTLRRHNIASNKSSLISKNVVLLFRDFSGKLAYLKTDGYVCSVINSKKCEKANAITSNDFMPLVKVGPRIVIDSKGRSYQIIRGSLSQLKDSFVRDQYKHYLTLYNDGRLMDQHGKENYYMRMLNLYLQ